MIIDKIQNLNYYKDLLPYVDNAMACLKSLPAYEEGRYEFEGGYLMVIKGTTKPIEEGEFELHRDYIDVHIMLEGSEELAWGCIDDLTVTQEFNPEKDSEWRKGSIAQNIKIEKDMFFAVFPQDGHMPYRHTKEAQDYLKICVKLPVKK